MRKWLNALRSEIGHSEYEKRTKLVELSLAAFQSASNNFYRDKSWRVTGLLPYNPEAVYGLECIVKDEDNPIPNPEPKRKEKRNSVRKEDEEITSEKAIAAEKKYENEQQKPKRQKLTNNSSTVIAPKKKKEKKEKPRLRPRKPAEKHNRDPNVAKELGLRIKVDKMQIEDFDMS